jgi:hypothetical protein
VTGAPGGRAIAYHHVLLRIAGWVPDDMIFEARELLAKGRQLEVAQMVGFAAIAHRIPIARGDAGLLRAAYGDVGLDTDPLSYLDVVPAAEMPWFAMAPGYPGRHADRAEHAVHTDDLTMAPAADDELDNTDRAAIAACSGGFEPGVAALWRAWRTPALPSVWPPPRRVFLIQANDNARERLPLVTSWLQQALVHAGEVAPQVEVFAELATCLRTSARRLGVRLLWTLRRSANDIAGYSTQSAVGVRGFPTRPTLERQERLDVINYLAGSPLLATTALMDDVSMPAKVLYP